jgi:opacity protein-like surface antigen
MFKTGFVVAALVIVLLVGANVALALDPIPKQPGFSGYIQPGLGYLSIKSNMVAKVLSFDLSDQKINNLNDEPDSQSTALFSLPFKLAYTFQGGRTQVFLGTEVGDLLSFDTAQQLAIKQEVGSLGVMQAGLLFSGATRVWKDPYVTNQSRDDTDRRNIGAQFTWDKMFGSNLELEYSIRKIDIGSEKSGQDPALALTNSEQDRLDRNGVAHKVSAAYQFTFAEKHRITPEIALSYDDLDGEAMANTGVDLKLNYTYLGDPLTLVFNASVGQADYDKSNPIYGKTRDDDRYGVSATVYYKNPWGWQLFGSEPMQFFVTGAYSITDSNIDFYNQEALLGMGGVAFRWK